jgi:rod shape-determining protein MreC
LRRLLNISQRTAQKTLIAEVVSVDIDPFVRKMLINKGSADGVYEGLPVLDAQGVVGKVVHTSVFMSSVQLITNLTHVLPVVIQRNGVRAIAEGTGATDQLSLLYLPDTADVQQGDLLLTSGLGGLFPRGYPVGAVASVKQDTDLAYIEVIVNPSSPLDKNKEVLLLWPEDYFKQTTAAVVQHQQSEQDPTAPVATPEDINVNSTP